MKPSRTARRRAARAGRDAPRIAGTIVDCSLSREHVDGGVAVTAHFEARENDRAHEVPLRGLEGAGQHADAISKAYLAAAGRMKSPKSRIACWSVLRTGLIRFLASDANPGVLKPPLDERLFIRFVHWLNHGSADGGTLALKTRRTRYRTALQVLEIGAGLPIPELSDLVLDWRADPWSGQNNATPPSDAWLSAATMTEVLVACRAEIEATMSLLGPLLDEGASYGKERLDVLTEADRLLAAVDLRGRNEGIVPPTNTKAARGSVARRLVLPSTRELAPFLLLLAHYTAFNPSTITEIEVRNIRRHRLGALRWIEIASIKRRGGFEQRAVFAVDHTPTNPGPVLDFLERWLAPVRRLIGSKHLLVAQVGDRINELRDPRTGNALGSGVRLWLRANGLPNATFSSIRKGMIDLAHLATNGDADQVRAIGQQRSPEIVSKHYTSEAARGRDRQRLASAVTELERMVLSDGKVDVRKLPDTFDRSAATPGFHCLDRYSQQMPGQRPNVACTAYGKCPMCPLAVVDLTSARSYGYLLLLDERIDQGLQGNHALDLASYIATWRPVLKALRTRWLAAFPDFVKAEARSLNLTPLPEVE